METSRNFDRIYETTKRVVLNRWGSSSSKTYSIMQLFFKRLITWEFRENEWFMKWVWSVVRQFRSQIEWSVLRDWKNIVDDEWYILSSRLSWWSVIKENKSNLTYEYEWRVLEFIWLDDFWKAKWPRRKILYCNEADQIKRKVFNQLLMRTEWPALLDWNPDDDEVWLNTEIEQKRAKAIWDVELIVSTFRDNWFLSDSIVAEILALKELDPAEWEVYWNWSYWKIKWAIFKEWIHWDSCVEIPENATFVWYWQDYWFTTDPTTLIEVWKGEWSIIYLNEIIYEHNLVNTYIDESQAQNSIQWHYEINWVDKSSKIRADSSEQKSNEELFEAWYNIEWVKKWPWSVVTWLKFMKRYKILITEKSFKTIKEFKKYVWAVDKNWKTLKDKDKRPIPKDKNNHCIDAARYWMTHLLGWTDMSDLDFSIW